MERELIKLAQELGHILQAKGLTIAIAESCTGGGICQLLTEIAGSSQWFERGFITYSNNSKVQMLGVKTQTIELYGAVSQQTAIEMAEGALKNSEADYVVSVTGIAGPEGGTLEKPVGTVFIALQNKTEMICYQKYFSGTRHEIRQKTIKFSLESLQTQIETA
jgi:nicotinamide-nucleotide amidase